MKRIITLSLLLSTAVACAQLEAIRTLQPDQGQEVRRPIEAKIFTSPQEEFPALEQELLDIFQSSATTLEGKQYTCRMLRYCASEACVPVLAPKLTNPDLSSFVRLVFQGLETIEVDNALIAALPRAGNTLKPGLIGTLGQRGSSKAVKAITPFLEGTNPEIQLAAITALGNIGGTEATKALIKAKVNPELSNDWKHAQLRCAETLDAKTAERAYRKFLAEEHDDEIRAAALVGLTNLSPEDAAPEVLSLLSSHNTRLQHTATELLAILPAEKLMGSLNALEPEYQVLVIDTLSDRQAVEAEGVILPLTASTNEAVRNIAFHALGQIGGAQSIEILVAEAPQEPPAFNALCALNADGTDAAVVQALKTSEDDMVKGKMLECLVLRQNRAALPIFVELAGSDWSRTCQMAIEGMAELVTEEDFSSYAELMLATDNKKKIQTLEKSVATAVQRLPDTEACARPLVAVYARAEGESKYTIIRALGSIGGTAAHELLTQAVASRDPEIKDAAVRGLANWPTLEVVDQLLEMATSADNETQRVIALRGYIRLAGTLSDFEPAFDMCQKAAAATDRPAEIKSVISCAKKFRNQEVLDFLTLQLDNAEVFTEAGWGICEISDQREIKRASIPVLERIAETATDDNLARKAKELAVAHHE